MLGRVIRRSTFTLARQLSGSPCCPPGSHGYLDSGDYKPQGQEVDLGAGLTCYRHGEGKTAVVHCYDVFGLNAGRSKQITDKLAKGRIAIMPDFFRKAPLFPDDVSYEEKLQWLTQFKWKEVEQDLFGRVLPYLQKEGVEKLAISGTCWGSWVVFKACTTDKFACGINWHPSVILARRFGETEEEIAEKLQAPQLILPASNDPDNMKEGGSVIEILKKKPFGVELKVYEELLHGYMPRGDLSDPVQGKAIEDAMQRAMAFLEKHL